MARIDALDNLPEIDMLTDEGITFDSILDEMIEDYESRYEELTNEELELYPGDSRRLMLNVIAGKLYQLAAIINERHKLNFLQYMYGDFLKNWGGNFGYKEDGTESAVTVLRFYSASPWQTDIVIPKGTRVTNGDHVYFATDEETVIVAGETYADAEATCTTAGTSGNGYMAGQLNIIVDPINLVEKVENLTESTGGHDEWTDQELRERIYNFPSTYSTAGPEECYEELVKEYSAKIVDVKSVTTNEAVVKIYVLLLDGELPTKEYLEDVAAYLKRLKVTPDTDRVEMLAPDPVEYELEVTYYISGSQKDIADGLKEAVEDATKEFVGYTKSKIGRAIKPDTLVSFAKAAGASRVEVVKPEYRPIASDQVAICRGIKLIYGGLEEE